MTVNRYSLIAFMGLAGCAGGLSQPYGTPPVPALFVQESDAGKAIEVQPGRKITFRLEANHTTGFRWLLASSGAALTQVGEPYYTAEKAPPGAVGGPGAEYWTFLPKGAGRQELRFEYRRPWEKDKPAAKALNYVVDVR